MEKLVQEWLRIDRDQETRSEIENLWRVSNNLELEQRLCKSKLYAILK